MGGRLGRDKASWSTDGTDRTDEWNGKKSVKSVPSLDPKGIKIN
jgi:hypothetical protein